MVQRWKGVHVTEDCFDHRVPSAQQASPSTASQLHQRNRHHRQYRYPSTITNFSIACLEQPNNSRQSRTFSSQRAVVASIPTPHLNAKTRDVELSMTALYSRSPLQVITMQSTQRPTRRKTTRHLFDDEDEPPAKRSKLDANTAVNGASKQASAKAPAPKPKKAKKCGLAILFPWK
jgi:hypothetical protein